MKNVRIKYEESGFIVHPYETGDSKYHASYGANANKTVRSFGKYADAKRYIASKGVKKALYDSPGGPRMVATERTYKKRRSTANYSGFSNWKASTKMSRTFKW